MEANCRSALQEHAVQLGLDMFALMAAECSLLLNNDRLAFASESGASVPPGDGDDAGDVKGGLQSMLACLKVWSDWMMCHEQLWNPPPLPLDPELG